MLKRLFSAGKTEQGVVAKIVQHISLTHSACVRFREAFHRRDRALMLTVLDLEREGDSIRREIVSDIYEGAFLPFIRPNICRFVEIVDEAFDSLQDAAAEFEYVDRIIDAETRDECIRIAAINIEIVDMLRIAFESLFSSGDLREKNLAIRIFEKRVDEIKFEIGRRLRKSVLQNFWEGKSVSDFISYITGFSDIIEDASDYLYILNVSLR